MSNKKIIAKYSLINAVLIYILFILMVKGGLNLNPLIIDFVKFYTLIIIVILIFPSFMICCLFLIKKQWNENFSMIVLNIFFILVFVYYLTN